MFIRYNEALLTRPHICHLTDLYSLFCYRWWLPRYLCCEFVGQLLELWWCASHCEYSMEECCSEHHSKHWYKNCYTTAYR